MTTQLEYARQGIITEEMKIVAKYEGLSEAFIQTHVAKGEIVIPCNPNRKNQNIVGIGTGLRTKVNASIGTSSDICDVNLEVQKAQAAEEEGADTLMELSVDGDLDEVRRTVLANTNLPVEKLTGRGTGIDDAALKNKIAVIQKGLDLHKPDPSDPIDILSKDVRTKPLGIKTSQGLFLFHK